MGSTKNISQAEMERLEILRRYRRLIEVWHTRKETADRWMVRKAFRVAADYHKDMRRKTGEPFIYHPLEVATIAAAEIGLGRTSIISALLHDTVEDTELTLKDVEMMFGADVARIIDGLTKIDEISDNNTTAQSETLKKVILTLSEDVRVILVKLCDRLHNMRTMEVMPRHKQMKIAAETQYIYAPLAHRLGLYLVKSELEELSFKYTQPFVYENIKAQIDALSKEKYNQFISFKEPLENALVSTGIKFELRQNKHSAYSLWKKMEKNDLTASQVYDTEGLDIILDTKAENERRDCWATYAVLTSLYKPNSDRLRDFISTPKANGYEAIHTTVMSVNGQWVDVHIRSRRMDEIANKGYAAFLKYKDVSSQTNLGLEDWLKRTRELLKEESDDSITFIDDFKSNLFSDEIYVFTPVGELKSLPMGATILDFAYTIHSDLGSHCIGGNINHKLFPPHHVLKTGDQIKIVDSPTVKPNTDWYKYVKTAKAKSAIKTAIKNQRRKHRESGENKLREIFKGLNIPFSRINTNQLMANFSLTSPVDLFYFVDKGNITQKEIKDVFPTVEGWTSWFKNIRIPYINSKQNIENKQQKEQTKEEQQKADTQKKNSTEISNADYTVEKCCNPVPGDDVIGLSLPGEPIQIHRTGCGRAQQLMTHYGKNIVKTKWKPQEGITFLASLKIKSVDKMGVLAKITVLASNEMKVNIRNMNLRSSEGLTDISMSVYVPDSKTIKRLIKKIKKIKEIVKVSRVDNLEEFV